MSTAGAALTAACNQFAASADLQPLSVNIAWVKLNYDLSVDAAANEAANSLGDGTATNVSNTDTSSFKALASDFTVIQQAANAEQQVEVGLAAGSAASALNAIVAAVDAGNFTTTGLEPSLTGKLDTAVNQLGTLCGG